MSLNFLSFDDFLNKFGVIFFFGLFLFLLAEWLFFLWSEFCDCLVLSFEIFLLFSVVNLYYLDVLFALRSLILNYNLFIFSDSIFSSL